MSLPNEADFALIKIGDGADPEVFTLICGMQDVSINEGVNTNDRYVRDCAKPGEVPQRKIKTTGKQLDISGSGLSNVDEITRLRSSLGISKNYEVELYKDDGTDAGALLGTYAGPFVMTSSNQNITRENAAASDISLASDGATTYTAAS